MAFSLSPFPEPKQDHSLLYRTDVESAIRDRNHLNAVSNHLSFGGCSVN